MLGLKSVIPQFACRIPNKRFIPQFACRIPNKRFIPQFACRIPNKRLIPIIFPKTYFSTNTTDSCTTNKGDETPQKYFNNVALFAGKLCAISSFTGIMTLGIKIALMKIISPHLCMGIFATCMFGSGVGSGYHLFQSILLREPLNSGTEIAASPSRMQVDADQIHVYIRNVYTKHVYSTHVYMGVFIGCMPYIISYDQFIPALIITSVLSMGPIAVSFLVRKELIRKESLICINNVLLMALIGIGSTDIILGYYHGSILAHLDLTEFTEFGKLLLRVNLYGYICISSIKSAIDTQMMFHNYDKGYRNFVKHSSDFSFNAFIIITKMLPIIYIWQYLI